MKNQKEKSFEEIMEENDKANKDLPAKKKRYVSRTKLGFCKNDGCNNKRRAGSAYCGKCK